MATASVSDQISPVSPVSADSPDFLRRMATLVPGIIYIFNHQTMSNEYSNRSIAELLGYSQQEAIDMGDALMSTLMHPEELPRIANYLELLSQSEDGIQHVIEYRALNKSGELVWLRSIDAVFDRDVDGSLLRHIGIAMDITAQKKAAERLRSTNRELEQLTYVATHDLKGPVTNMATLLESIAHRCDDLPATYSETLDLMREVCDQATQKLHMLVRVSEASTGQFPAPRPVDVSHACATAIEKLEPVIRNTGGKIKTDLKVAEVSCVPDALSEILEDLVRNALIYCPEGRRPEILIRSFDRDGASYVEVHDNGDGLDPERDTERVFSLFQRAHAHPPGDGVSLYVARRLMERLGGSVELSGSASGGAVFSLVFPH
ncbi:PAS domain-containing sensor histidine kinase [uncultured Roseobacter sp.]|uniref:sensor histidine kinase n=1 Tax=uncultured Roseobacter sp. TaxID=114847 RepID=UPI002615C384|nr:PAS domain-containing sensor histidine kinase [uncultured Roseobacter sp.]